MKVYWDKTAVIGLVGFTISLLLILCFMDSLSHPLVGIFLCLFGILLCGIYGALPKAGSPERQNHQHCLQSRLERLGMVIKYRRTIKQIQSQPFRRRRLAFFII